jgi:arsenite/tail-anchored protein-transporting ATPase
MSRTTQVASASPEGAGHIQPTLTSSAPGPNAEARDDATPVPEAARLQEDLKRAGITPWAWVINASLAATGITHPILAARAATETPERASVRDGLASRYAVVPMLAEDPVGADRLRALVGRAPAIA